MVVFRSNASINIWKSISLTFIILNESYRIDLCLVRLFKNLNLFNNNHHMFCCCQNIVRFVALFYSEGVYNRKCVKNPLGRAIFLHWTLPPSVLISNTFSSHLVKSGVFCLLFKYSAVVWQKPHETLRRENSSQYSSEKVQCFLQ